MGGVTWALTPLLHGRSPWYSAKIRSRPMKSCVTVAKSKRDVGEEIFRVLPKQVDQAIASTLREWLPGKSWSDVRRLLKSRRVLVNGNLCADAGYRLRLSDVIKILPHSIARPANEGDVRIRHLDKHLIVIEKPAGVTSTRHADERQLSPRERQLQPTLDELLPWLIAKREGHGRGKVRRVRAVQRLDRETSGVMVFARTAEAQRHLEHQFRLHTVQRRYIAIARGTVAAQTIESRLVHDRGDGRRGSTNLPNVGKHAVTHVRPIERLGNYTMVECRLETGRTHQIRIHLAENGHPLCGDKVYGQGLFRSSRPDISGAPRLALCAVELGFVHPISGEAMHFEMPLSPDLMELANRLRGRETDEARRAKGEG